MRSRPSITRREVLRGLLGVTGMAGVALTSGCGVFAGSAPPTDQPNPLEGFLRDTIGLADQYEASLAAVPALGPIINGPLATHRAHAKALADAIGKPAPRATGTGTAKAAGTDRGAVLAALVQAETKARDAAVEACLSTTNRLAPLVGSIAAARASHLEILR